MLDFRRLSLRGPVLEWRQFPETSNIPLANIVEFERLEFWQGVIAVRYWDDRTRSVPVLLGVFDAEDLAVLFADIQRQRPELDIPNLAPR